MDKLIRTIKAVSVKGKAEGSIGFLTQEEDNWYNVAGDEFALDTILKAVIQKGNKIEFEMLAGCPVNFKLLEKAKVSEKKNWADDMTNYEDLLKAAHKKAKDEDMYLSMESRPKENAEGKPIVDFEKKTALYEATLTLRNKEGKILQQFVDTGDAEGITNDTIKPHFNRMASTRAMARCYRIYTNNAAVAKEETGQ